MARALEERFQVEKYEIRVRWISLRINYERLENQRRAVSRFLPASPLMNNTRNVTSQQLRTEIDSLNLSVSLVE